MVEAHSAAVIRVADARVCLERAVLLAVGPRAAVVAVGVAAVVGAVGSARVGLTVVIDVAVLSDRVGGLAPCAAARVLTVGLGCGAL